MWLLPPTVGYHSFFFLSLCGHPPLSSFFAPPFQKSCRNDQQWQFSQHQSFDQKLLFFFPLPPAFSPLPGFSSHSLSKIPTLPLQERQFCVPRVALSHFTLFLLLFLVERFSMYSLYSDIWPSPLSANRGPCISSQVRSTFFFFQPVFFSSSFFFRATIRFPAFVVDGRRFPQSFRPAHVARRGLVLRPSFFPGLWSGAYFSFKTDVRIFFPPLSFSFSRSFPSRELPCLPFSFDLRGLHNRVVCFRPSFWVGGTLSTHNSLL